MPSATGAFFIALAPRLFISRRRVGAGAFSLHVQASSTMPGILRVEEGGGGGPWPADLIALKHARSTM